MKRQICSYDIVAVPSSSYTVTDGEGMWQRFETKWAIWRAVGCPCSKVHLYAAFSFQ
jgi:hypothetical protein